MLAVDHAVHVDGVAGQHRSQLDVLSTATDGQAHLAGIQEHLGLLVLLVEIDARHLSGVKCALYEQLRVGSPVDHVDILVAELAHDTVHTASTHADAGAHGVDTVVEALHGHLGALSGDASHRLDGDEAVGNLGHLLLKQMLKELTAGARQDDLRVVVLVVHTLDDGSHRLALAVLVGGNLLALGQDQLVVLVINEQHLALPHLIDLG